MPQVIATLGKVPNTGCLIIGDKGMMASTNDYGQDAYVALKGEEKMKSTTKHEALVNIPKTIERCCKGGQYMEFVNACKAKASVTRMSATPCRCWKACSSVVSRNRCPAS